MFEYTSYIDSLANFMAKNGYTIKPFPKIKFQEEEQGIFGHTANYDPETRTVNLWIAGRHPKDVLRSLAHELIHHKQNLEGRLNEGAYTGDKITEDNKLIKLEEEAYLNGNISFRKWTETMQKEGKDK